MRKQNQIIPSTLMSQISNRIETLKVVAEKAEETLKIAPDGKIHGASGKTKGKYRYFVRTDGADKTGLYLPKKEDEKIKALCQKRYYEEVLKRSTDELKVLEKAMAKLEGDSLLSAYTSLSEGVRKQINPILVDDETYTNRWLSQEYEGLLFDINDKTEHYTDKDERVRSKSEVIIANYLNHHNIPYLYEKPIRLKSGKILYPDFTILDIFERREKYLEHLGKLGDIDYLMRNIQKLNEYKENSIYLGDTLFFTYENAATPLSIRDLEKVLEGMGIVY